MNTEQKINEINAHIDENTALVIMSFDNFEEIFDPDISIKNMANFVAFENDENNSVNCQVAASNNFSNDHCYMVKLGDNEIVELTSE